MGHDAVIAGNAGPALVPSPGTPLTTAGANKRAQQEAGRGSKHRDQGNGVAAAAVPVGFDRVCALLAEAVIGMMASTLPSSTGQGSRPGAPTQGDSKHTTGSGATRCPASLDDQIVEELRECGCTSPAALRAKLGLQRTPCTKALNRLLAKGVLIGEGSTRKRVYRLAQPSQSAAA
ncbi:MAG: winged helix-turn-helix domain-containing protein [Phycisphaerae bacterium]